MQKVDTAELRRLHEAAIQETSTPQDLRRSMNAAYLALPALLEELEAAREENERLTDVIFQGEGIDATGELGITRENFREWVDARDRHMKLIGAAEELERIAATESAELAEAIDNFEDGVQCEKRSWIADLRTRAATLRQEAEDGRND